MTSVRSAVLYSSIGKYLTMAIGLVSTMVIARLLTPSEIGTFAIASSIVMIMSEFRILGANTYLIREKNIDPEKIRAAYGLTILVSWSLGLVVVVGAFPLAEYFNINDVSYIFLILSVSFLIAPYISIPDAILSREYNFKAINITKVVASITQLAVTLALIISGYSYYSLAIGYLCNIFVQALFMLYFSRHHRVYRPVFRGLRPIAKLGVYTSISHVVKRAQHTTPDMVIGKLGTTADVGIFSRGLGFMVFVSDIIVSGLLPVALPYLSDVKKRGENVASAYINATVLITGIAWPIFIVASVASLPAIRLMFGDQWDEAAPLASVVAFWALFRCAHVVLPQALLAAGEEGSLVAKELFVFFVFIVSIIFGYLESQLIGVSYAFVISSVFDFFLSLIFLKIKIKMGIAQYFKSLIPSFLVTTTCWAAIFLISKTFNFNTTSELLVLFYISSILPFVWMVSVFIFRHPIKIEVLSIYRKIFS